MDRALKQERMQSALGVAAMHALLGYALITGLGVEIGEPAPAPLKLFDVVVEPPPAPVEVPVQAQVASPAQEGAAAPPNLKATASPVVAPKPEIELKIPPAVVAAPVPGVGAQAAAGVSLLPGPGSGSGGIGNGVGSGGRGEGTGGGGALARAKLLKGRIVDADYPRAARQAEIGGTVIVRFKVGTDGRASACKVSRSSGHPELDATTCRLIEQRFRYEPARDASGKPVADLLGWKQVWWLERRGHPVAGDPSL